MFAYPCLPKDDSDARLPDSGGVVLGDKRTKLFVAAYKRHLSSESGVAASERARLAPKEDLASTSSRKRVASSRNGAEGSLLAPCSKYPAAPRRPAEPLRSRQHQKGVPLAAGARLPPAGPASPTPERSRSPLWLIRITLKPRGALAELPENLRHLRAHPRAKLELGEHPQREALHELSPVEPKVPSQPLDEVPSASRGVGAPPSRRGRFLSAPAKRQLRAPQVELDPSRIYAQKAPSIRRNRTPPSWASPWALSSSSVFLSLAGRF